MSVSIWDFISRLFKFHKYNINNKKISVPILIESRNNIVKYKFCKKYNIKIVGKAGVELITKL